MEINNKFISFEIIDVQQFTDINQKRKHRLDRVPRLGFQIKIREGGREREGEGGGGEGGGRRGMLLHMHYECFHSN